MPVHLPPQITSGCFMNGRGDRGKIGGNVMLEAVLANEVQQLLHPWDLNYTCASEGIQRVVSESALANVAAYLARGVIGRETGRTYRPRFDQSHAGAKRVLFANRSEERRVGKACIAL